MHATTNRTNRRRTKKNKQTSNVQPNNELENVLFIKYNLHIIFVLFYVVPWFVPHTDALAYSNCVMLGIDGVGVSIWMFWSFNVEAFAFQFTFNEIQQHKTLSPYCEWTACVCVFWAHKTVFEKNEVNYVGFGSILILSFDIEPFLFDLLTLS